MKRNEQGVTMLVVLVLLSVMLLGGMALAKLTEVGTLASGNTAYREASIQASEVGLNTAFQAVKDLPVTDEEADAGGWYFATIQGADGTGVPAVDFDAAAEVTVGNYTIHYVVERMCEVADVTSTLRECLVKQIPQENKSRSAGKEELDPPNSKQFRVTIRVTGPKDTQTWVQSLVTKG
jgi:Tfp pilus assembly protein PilX